MKSLNAILRLTLLAVVVAVSGCGDWTKQRTPEPLKPLPQDNAAVAVQDYVTGLAAAFDEAADSFEKHQSPIAINERLGDAQRDARLKAFTPLMAALNATRPASDASDSEREAADLKSAALLRKYANQCRGVK